MLKKSKNFIIDKENPKYRYDYLEFDIGQFISTVYNITSDKKTYYLMFIKRMTFNIGFCKKTDSLFLKKRISKNVLIYVFGDTYEDLIHNFIHKIFFYHPKFKEDFVYFLIKICVSLKENDEHINEMLFKSLDAQHYISNSRRLSDLKRNIDVFGIYANNPIDIDRLREEW